MDADALRRAYQRAQVLGIFDFIQHEEESLLVPSPGLLEKIFEFGERAGGDNGEYALRGVVGSQLVEFLAGQMHDGDAGLPRERLYVRDFLPLHTGKKQDALDGCPGPESLDHRLAARDESLRLNLPWLHCRTALRVN